MHPGRMRFQRGPAKEQRDGWDYAEIVSRFISGIAIAFLGIFIPATLQRTQIELAENQAEAQLQLERSRLDSERAVKQGELTSTLIESLASSDSKRREIALIALRSVAPAEVYERVLLTILKNDDSPNVRFAAVTELAASVEPSTSATLFALSKDLSYEASERQRWLVAARTISLRSELPENACIYLAVGPGYSAFESRSTGGFFTKALVDGLSVATGEHQTAHALGSRVISQVLYESNERMKPFIHCGSLARETTIVSDEPHGRVVAVVVGINEYQSPEISSLRTAISDAEKVAALIRSDSTRQNQVLTALGKEATGDHIDDLLDRARSLVGPQDTFVVFFTGHGVADRGGYLEGVHYDHPRMTALTSRGATFIEFDDRPMARGPLNIRRLKTYLETFDARLKLLILDSCYPESLRKDAA